MRIELTRKRNPPPYSDSPPPLLLQLPPNDSPNQTPAEDPQPSDITVVPVSGTNGEYYSSHEIMNNSTTTRCFKRDGWNQDSSLGDGEGEVDAEENLTVVTNPRDFSYGAETSAGSSPCPYPSHEGHWCEEDKLFPLKKRRAKFIGKVRARMATDKEQRNSVREPAERNTEKIWAEQKKNGAKRKQCGEGGVKIQVANSRCSRNSGNGWRCNRPAVLGYVSCEHHLTRARSNQNRNQRTRHRNNVSFKKVYTSLYSEDGDNDERGVVKARSISCLLGQTAPICSSTFER